MNSYSKFIPNVFLLKSTEKYEKGEVTNITTKYGKENEIEVHNLIYERDGFFFYSFVRLDGFNSQERAKAKAEKLAGASQNAEKRSNEWREKANEGRDFLVLGEPIKVGHHSEKKYRALFERNNNRMRNAFKESEKAESYKSRIAYWESLSTKIDLSMPESLEYFSLKLTEAIEKHKGLKDGTIKREHSFSLTYAKKEVNEYESKVRMAERLWN